MLTDNPYSMANPPAPVRFTRNPGASGYTVQLIYWYGGSTTEPPTSSMDDVQALRLARQIISDQIAALPTRLDAESPACPDQSALDPPPGSIPCAAGP